MNKTNLKILEELKVKDYQLSSIYDSIQDILFYLEVLPDENYRFISTNSSFSRITGIPKEFVIGKLVSEVIEEPSLSLVLRKYKEAIDSHSSVQWEETTQYPNGLLTGIITINPVFDANENCTHLVGSVHDITDRKFVENLLVESEKKYRALFENMNTGFVLFEVILDDFQNPIDLIIVAANQEFEKTTSLQLEKVIGQRLTHVLPGIENDDADWIGTYGKLALGGGERHFEEPSEILGKHYTVNAYQSAPKQCAVTFLDITERIHAQQAIKENAANLISLINNTKDSIWSLDRNYNFIVFNKAYADIYLKINGIELKKGMNAKKHLSADQLKFWESMFEPVFEGEMKVFEFNHSIDGKQHYYQTALNPIYEDGLVIGASAISVDITDIKMAEVALNEAQKIAKTGSFNYDLLTKTIETSESFNEIVGIKLDDKLTFDIWRTITHPVDTPNNQKALENTINTGEKFDLEYRIITKEKKELKWIHGLGEVIYKNGVATNFFGTIQDITDRKRVQIELKTAKDFSEGLIESMHDGLIVFNRDLKVLGANAALFKMTGFTKEEIVGNKIPLPFHPEQDTDRKKLFGIIKKLFNNELKDSFETEYVHKDGNRIPVYLTISKIYDERGEIEAYFALVQDITVRNKQLEEIRAAREFSEELILTMADGLATVDINGVAINVNNALCKMTGFTKEELIGVKAPFPYWPEESYELINSAFKKTLQGGENRFNLTFRHKNGERFPVSVSAKSIKDKDGKNIAFFATVQDLSEQVKAKNEMLKAIDFSEGLIKSMHEGLIVFSLDLEIVSVNPAFCKMTGFKEKELVGKKYPFAFNPPEHKKVLEKRKVQALNDTLVSAYESLYMHKDGHRFPVSILISNIYDSNNNKVAFFATVQDITERQKAETEVRLAKEFSENLLQSMTEGFLLFNKDLEVLNVNPALCNMVGYTREEIVGKKVPLPFNPPEDESQRVERAKKILKGNIDDSYEVQYLHKNGHRFPILVIVSTIYNLNGEIEAFFATIQDITERKKAELELRATKEFTDNLVMSMQEGLIIVNPGGKIILVNQSTCNMLGYSKEELVGMDLPYPFAKPEDFEEIGRTNQKVAEGKNPEFQFEFIRKNGEHFLATFLTGTITNDKNEVIALFGTMKDISKEEKAKRALEEAAKKSALKKDVILELTTYVGKDFNTSLNKITKLAAKTLNAERVSVWRFNEDGTEIFCRKLYISGKDSFEEGHRLKFEDNPDYFKALYKNRTIIVKDAQKDKITKKFTNNYLKPNQIRSLMDVFINSTNGYYGIICFEHVGLTNREWLAEDQEFATSLASIVSVMVESKERLVAEGELKTEKEFSETLITSLNEGLSVVDLEGTHIKVNDALCQMTGFSEEELVGIKAPFPYWPPEEYDSIFKAFNNPLKNLSINKEAVLMKKTGERFPVSLSDAIIKNKEGKIIAYFTTITDISMRVKAENILKENIEISNQRKNIIIELANLIGEDLRTSLRKIATTTAKALNVELVTIWEYENDDSELISKLFYNSKANKFIEKGLVVKKVDYPSYFNAFMGKNSLNISDVVNNPITKEFAKEYFVPNNIFSRIDVLIYGRFSPFGIISFESSVPNRVFNNEEESFATSIASIVSLMIESYERKLAESSMFEANEKLLEANKELNILRNQLEQENVYLRNELELVFNFEEMVYGSVEFSHVLSEVEKVAPTNATVLLLGESGTGKELIARAVHKISLRHNKPLIKVNCSAIPRELIESELFGHKKGSFTGAFSDKIGKFELADGGTLFLDEIGELPLDMQPKILRFLQEGEIEVVGGTGLKKLDVRVIAATNRNLKEEIEKKQFREDLYFRLNVFPIVIPPLRKRKDDIPLLVEHFVDKFNKAYGKNIQFISDSAMKQLSAYEWPGNIRELENLIERASILSTSKTLIIPGFESEEQKSKTNILIKDKDLSFDTAQRNHIVNVLQQCNWKISGTDGASAKLGLKPSTLRDKMSKLDIKKP